MKKHAQLEELLASERVRLVIANGRVRWFENTECKYDADLVKHCVGNDSWTGKQFDSSETLIDNERIKTDPDDVKLYDASCIAVLWDHDWRDSWLPWHRQLSDDTVRITDVSWLQQLDWRDVNNECLRQLRLSVLQFTPN